MSTLIALPTIPKSPELIGDFLRPLKYLGANSGGIIHSQRAGNGQAQLTRPGVVSEHFFLSTPPHEVPPEPVQRQLGNNRHRQARTGHVTGAVPDGRDEARTLGRARELAQGAHVGVHRLVLAVQVQVHFFVRLFFDFLLSETFCGG